MKIIVLLLLCLSAYGSEQFFLFDKSKVKIIIDLEKGVTLSKSCLQGKSYKCAAFSSLSKVTPTMLKGELLMDEQVGGIYCSKVGGLPVMGVDKRKNQTPFCYFEKDRSYVSYNTLVGFANRRDIKKKKIK